MHTYVSLQRFCVSSRGFLFGGLSGAFLSGRFHPGWFLSVPLLSEYIHYNRKLTITFNFRFHMYEIFLKCDVTCSWTPTPVTPSRTPSHRERDVLYGRPLCWSWCKLRLFGCLSL